MSEENRLSDQMQQDTGQAEQLELQSKSSELGERLLDGWLRMSMSIWNERLVSDMTYNESMVCNLLYKQKLKSGQLLTPTDLCSRLRIRKSQMNVILNRLEKDGILIRQRSMEDRRNVYLKMTEEGVALYRKAHAKVLQLPQELIRRLGNEKMDLFAAMMTEVADCFDKIMTEKE